MIDPRLATLGLSCAFVAFVLVVRDRRGAPPAPAIEASIPTGIELTVAHAGTIKTYRFGRRILVGRSPSAGSRNGTLVNGVAMSAPRRLDVDDELTVGPAALVFRGVGAWR
ncbi:MAG: FHA domain-containing protein [Vulcanimicrobiaceae bacterium]